MAKKAKAAINKKSAESTIAPNIPKEGTSVQPSIQFIEDLKKQWLETIDALPDPFMIVDQNYKIQKANRAMAEASGSTVKNIVGKTCYKVFANRSAPCESCQMKRSYHDQPSQPYELHQENNKKWYEVVSKGMTSSENGHEKKVVLQLYRDRTETRQLQQQVAHQEKLASLGQLAGGFAHEINNPIGGILVFSQMLLREVDPSTSHYQDIKEIESAAKRCKTIVEGMLDFSRKRPIARKLTLTNYHETIESAVKFAFIDKSQAKNIDIAMDLKARHFEGLSDSSRLMQVFINLLTNARQAIKKSGSILVTTANSGNEANHQRIVITIADNGCGIEKANLKKIFDPFFTTKEPGQGTGLGLSIVHGIVQDLGGTIEATSTVGVGTTMTLTFNAVTQ
jgi:two-component system, NtrC family, sensor kinase